MSSPAAPRLVMMGTGAFAEPTFAALLAAGHDVVALFTQPDRGGAQRGSTRMHGGMKAIAEQHNVPVHQPESVNTPEGVELLKQLRPDLLVVAAYGQILKPELLATARLGGINVHASLLPKYRGAAPIAWAIANGETQTGVTIIHMTPALDAGDMLAQETLDILPEETAGELEARLAPMGALLALKVIAELVAGTAQGVKQDKSQATKAPKLTKEHGQIDWTKTAEQVCNHIRAMQPWPTAYTFWHHEGKAPLRVIITRAFPLQVRRLGDPLPPGFIWRDSDSSPSSFAVITGQGAVGIQELQPAGKKRMSAEEFLRGHPIRDGDHFGPETP